MIRISIIALLLIFSQSVDYRSVFSGNYDNAVVFMRENAELFIGYSERCETDPEIIMPVLFPEAIRFSIISDYLETKSLELAYVYAGTADFSIGYFQMKPSFAESLEETIISNRAALQKYDSLLIPSFYSFPEIRKERITRLKKLEYQVLYANCLYDALGILYPDFRKTDKIEKIKFMSTAYNHGFLTGQDEISEYSDKAFFPMGGRNNTEMYVYNEISLFFYQHDLAEIIAGK